LEASKFFDRINHLETEIIKYGANNNICSSFLYKEENAQFLILLNELIGQFGEAKNVLKREAAKAFGKEFDENQRSMHF